MNTGRSYALGLALGSLWLITAGLGFCFGVVILARMPSSMLALAALAILGALLGALGVLVIRAAARMPKDDSAARSRGALRTRFIVVVVIEVVAFAVVTAACVVSRRFEYIAPLNLIVVGVHFLPLANLFGVRRYYALGIGFCALAILTMLFVSPTARTGALLSWVVLPSLGCSLLAIAIGTRGLRESWQLARAVDSST